MNATLPKQVELLKAENANLQERLAKTSKSESFLRMQVEEMKQALAVHQYRGDVNQRLVR